MSGKESSGFKLGVVLVLAVVVGGALFVKSRLGSGDAPRPTPHTASVSSAPLPVPAPAPSASVAAADAGAKPTSADRVALLDAAAAGDLAKVQGLAQKGVDLTGIVALAARSGNVDLMKWLIDRGVDVHEGEESSSPPLLEAEPHDAMAALLLARGVKEPSLETAVVASAPKTVARVLGKKADPNAVGTDGHPLLRRAVQTGSGTARTAIVKSLLEAGARADGGLGTDAGVAGGAASESPLHLALREVEKDSAGALDVVKLLVAKTPVDADAMMIALNMRSERKGPTTEALLAGKVTPEAAYRGLGLTTDAKLVPRLAAKGVAWKVKDPYVEEPPLVSASMRVDVEMVKALLTAGAPPDGSDEGVDTPLLAVLTAAPADSEDGLEIVKLLLAKGASANKRTKDGRRPLFTAAERGQLAMVNALLARGANPNDQVNGTTPLEAAENGGHAEVAKALAAKGARKAPTPKP